MTIAFHVSLTFQPKDYRCNAPTVTKLRHFKEVSFTTAQSRANEAMKQYADFQVPINSETGDLKY